MLTQKKIPMQAAKREDGRGWDVVTKSGVATVIWDYTHLTVTAPFREGGPGGWYMGRRRSRPNALRRKTYLAPIGMDPVMAVRFCLAHGWES